MRPHRKLLTIILLFILLQPPETASAQAEAAGRHMEISMLMDVSRIYESELARLVKQTALTFTLSCGENQYVFSLRSGENIAFPLEAGAQQINLTETVDAGFIESYGDPECSCVWTSEIPQQQSAEFFCEYTYQNKNGRTETVSGAEKPSYKGDGLNTLQEKRITVHLLTPEEGSIKLLITNIADTVEYGALRIDQQAEGESGVFDILVWLGNSEGAEALPVAAGTPYYYRASAAEPWCAKKVENAGIISLVHGASALFSPLPEGAPFCVRETKNSAKGYLVSYYCDLPSVGVYTSGLENQGGAQTLKGCIRPCYEARHSQTPSSALAVTVKNVRQD